MATTRIIAAACGLGLALTAAQGASAQGASAQGAPAQGVLAQGNPAMGKTAFQERCGLCHTAGPDDGDGGQGPMLKGVVGRPSASAPGFSYTPALRKAHLVWTPANLDRFLAAPSKLVPGTAMPIATPDPKTRADLIAYLATVK